MLLFAQWEEFYYSCCRYYLHFSTVIERVISFVIYCNSHGHACLLTFLLGMSGTHSSLATLDIMQKFLSLLLLCPGVLSSSITSYLLSLFMLFTSGISRGLRTSSLYLKSLNLLQPMNCTCRELSL